MPTRIVFILALAFTLTTLLQTSVYAQDDSAHVFRIKISGCTYSPETRNQSGFWVNSDDVVGVVTALHGAADCNEISATAGDGTTFDGLEPLKVDIDRDVVLLSSTQLGSISGDGVEIEPAPVTTEGAPLRVIGYPINLDAPLPTQSISLRGLTELVNLIPDHLIAPLYKRKSPDVDIQVLSLEGHLLPGHSGAPVFNQNNKLIGVGNGGLESGAVEVSWAVPWSEIEWQTIASMSPEDQERYYTLRDSSPLLFSFISSTQVKEEIVTKTICKSAFNYENIDQLKKDLELNAKRAAVEELFGEFLMGYSAMADSVLLEDQILSSTIGYVRVAGTPQYKNHEGNLAEVCVSIEALVTEEDRQNLEPVALSNDRCLGDSSLTVQELEKVARDKAVIEALLDYDPRLEGQDENDLTRLMKNKDFSGSEYDAKTGAYCAVVTGEVLPIEIAALLGGVDVAPEFSENGSKPTPKDVGEPGNTSQQQTDNLAELSINPIAEIEPNDLMDNAQALTTIGMETPINASITASLEDQETGDEDWFSFPAVVGQEYVVEIFDASNTLALLYRDYNCDGYDDYIGLRIIIYDPSGNEITRQCSLSGTGSVHTSSQFTAAVNGQHFIQIAAHNAQVSGNYYIRVLPRYNNESAKWDPLTLEPNNRLANAFLMQAGRENAITSQIEPRNEAYSTVSADTDYFRFEAVAGEAFVIELFDVSNTLALKGAEYNCNGYDLYSGLRLHIYDPSGSSILIQCENEGAGNVHTSAEFIAGYTGIFFIRVAAHEDTMVGSYSIRILPKYGQQYASWDTDSLEPNNRALNSYQLEVNDEGLVSAIESRDDQYSTNKADVDWFRFEAEAGQVYKVQLFNVDERLDLVSVEYNCDGYDDYKGLLLSIYDPSVNLVEKRCTPNSAGEIYSFIDFTASRDGIYHIRVTPHADNVSGKYGIHVTTN
jgi:hypothetical protein